MKKKILCWVLAAMLAVPATALAADEPETEAAENQRKATIMVVSITGNELTYMEINTPQEEEGEPQSDEMPEPESGDMPQMDGMPGGGQMPDMGNMQDMMEQFQENGGGPGGGQMPDMGSMQDMIEQFQNGDADMSGMQDMIEQFQNGDVDMSGMQDMIEQFQENGGGMGGGQMPGGDNQQGNDGQEGSFGAGFGGGQGLTTVYLQVGVVVHADGKDKTFSILEAGDELEVLFETDEEGNEVITEMWLLDT